MNPRLFSLVVSLLAFASGNMNAAPSAQMIDASRVRLLPGSPFFDRQDLHRNGYVRELDVDKLLFPYRRFANVAQPANVKGGYLFEQEPLAGYADYFERALYNHILSSIAPDTGRVTYFHPLHGDFKIYLPGTLERAKDVPQMVSVLYGPLVLAARLGKEGMPKDFVAKDTYRDLSPAPVPAISSDSDDPARWLRLVDPATLTFGAYGCGEASGLRFQPINAVHHDRYSVYLPLVAPTEAEGTARTIQK